MSRSRHLVSSVEGRHHAASHPDGDGDGDGEGGGATVRAAPIQPLPSTVLAPVYLPIQQEACWGGPLPQVLELQNW